jgi:hypothetical protein
VHALRRRGCLIRPARLPPWETRLADPRRAPGAGPRQSLGEVGPHPSPGILRPGQHPVRVIQGIKRVAGRR